ncbi:MAG: NFACT RNA binding domain-containing protein [Planctomycetota bacterium]|jgi:predicted ribosome quality control (RQC) complex YloA/Tae2 family protein
MSRREKSFQPAEPRVYTYELPGCWQVLAGKTDEDNEILSLIYANPRDWWFHVRSVPGSHVILQAKPGEEPDKQTLKRAAAIAAFHSKARKGGTVTVSATLARFVTKPRGSETGTVQIRREVLFKVKPAIPESNQA